MTKATKKALFTAVQDNDLAAIDAILARDSDAIEAMGEHNAHVRDKTPLMYAIQCWNAGLAEALLDRGADASATMAGGPRLSVLAICCQVAHCHQSRYDDWVRVATRLLDLGADPTSALWPALGGFGKIVKRADLIRLLIERGANPDKKLRGTRTTPRELVANNRRLYTDEVLALLKIEPES